MIRAIHFPDRDDHRESRIAGSFFIRDDLKPGDEGDFWFWCPCGCGSLCAITVGIEHKPDGGPTWNFNGKTLTPTLHPSVNRHGCGWHGWLRDGYWKEV